jgi:cysteine-rich repeat protein
MSCHHLASPLLLVSLLACVPGCQEDQHSNGCPQAAPSWETRSLDATAMHALVATFPATGEVYALCDCPRAPQGIEALTGQTVFTEVVCDDNVIQDNRMRLSYGPEVTSWGACCALRGCYEEMGAMPGSLLRCYPSAASQPGVRCDGFLDSRCTLCGNGLLDFEETCDDGNHVDGDGCDHTCEVEPP